MREQGVVVGVEGRYATVRVNKKDECSKCGMCLFPKGADSIEFKAFNKENAKIDDKVVIERQKDGKLLGAILVFLIPLILIGVCVLVGYLVLNSEISILIMSVSLILIWFIVLSLIDKRLKNAMGYMPVIVSIDKE